MKKIIIILMALSFGPAISAQENVPAEGIAGVWEKTKDKTSELYGKIKDNKYARYGVVGTGAALTIVGTCFGINYIRNNPDSKRNNSVD